MHYHSNWKRKQDAVYWVKLSRAQDRGLRFGQTKSHAIIVHSLVPADCIYREISQNGDPILFERLSTPRRKSHCKAIGIRSSCCCSSSLLMLCRPVQGNLLRDSESVVDKKPQFEINLRVEGVSMRRLVRRNQSTMDRTREAFAALKTPYYRTTVIPSRGRRSGHNPWKMDHQKAMDARRGATKRHEYTSILDRWPNDEIYRASQLVHGWTEGWVKYLDYISKIDVSHEAPYPRRLRYERTPYMRAVDSNKEAGPLCQQPDYKSSADALVSFQRAQGKGVPHIPRHLRTRQNNSLDPAIQTHLEWLSLNWKTYFSSSSSSTWTESPTWWSSSSWDRQWQEWDSQAWQDKEW